MTTTVCDLANQLLTADTRWSCGHDGALKLSDGRSYFVYSDDTGFDKITQKENTALITAGHGRLISEWKKWWKSDLSTPRPQTEINGENAVNLAIIDLANNRVLFDAGMKYTLFCVVTNKVKAFSAGSGGVYAANSLLVDGCAIKAVETAAGFDYCTGNTVSFLCYKTHINNLNTDDEYDTIVEGLLERGFIMELNQSVAISAGTELKKHPLAQEIAQQFKTGQAAASAPVPGVGSFTWDQGVEDKFKAAIKQVQALRAG